MAALAEIKEGLAREMRLFDRKGFDEDARPAEKHIALAACLRPELLFNDDGEFQEIRGADQGAIGGVDQFGRPCSS